MLPKMLPKMLPLWSPLRPTLPLEYFPSGLHARVGSLKRVCRCPATALAARFAELGLGDGVPRRLGRMRRRAADRQS